MDTGGEKLQQQQQQQQQHYLSRVNINTAVVVTAARASALKKTLKVLVCQLQIVNMSVEISQFLCLLESTKCARVPILSILSLKLYCE